MAQKPRQIRMEQKGAMAAMQALESKSDDELERETRHRAAAQALLGARASEKYDAKAARRHFQKAVAAARPQERMQIRRMADASLAMAERRPDDLKEAMERLGQAPPSKRQLLLLRFMALVAPGGDASLARKVLGYLVLLLLVLALLAVGFGIAQLLALPFGGASTPAAVMIGILLVVLAITVLVLVGRRRQAKARDQAAAQRATTPAATTRQARRSR